MRISRTIVFRQSDFDKITDHLYADTSCEAMAIAFFRKVRTGASERLLVGGVEIPSKADYEIRSPARVGLKSGFLEKCFKRCEKEKLHLLDIHTHPWQTDVDFSGIDDHEARHVKGPYLRTYLPGVQVVYIVHGKESGFLSARTWNYQERSFGLIAKIMIL